MYYLINNEHTIRHANNIEEWINRVNRNEGWHGWFRVNETVLEDGLITISTVFLGIDHSIGNDHGPILFETMTFSDNPDLDAWMERCSTWDEAVVMHDRMVERFQNFNSEEK